MTGFANALLSVVLLTASIPSSARVGRSVHHFGEFDQVAERVGEESELATDGRQDPRLGDDLDTTRAKFVEGLIHAGNVEAEMVETAILQAVAQIRIGRTSAGSVSPPPSTSR